MSAGSLFAACPRPSASCALGAPWVRRPGGGRAVQSASAVTSGRAPACGLAHAKAQASHHGTACAGSACDAVGSPGAITLEIIGRGKRARAPSPLGNAHLRARTIAVYRCARDCSLLASGSFEMTAWLAFPPSPFTRYRAGIIAAYTKRGRPSIVRSIGHRDFNKRGRSTISSTRCAHASNALRISS
jgi:hypothetical protein